MPGFNKVIVHLSYNDASMDQTYFVSRREAIFKGDIYDINKSPFQANLDKIKTDQQPSFGAPADAPVTLVVFGDFECPYCKEEARSAAEHSRHVPGQGARVLSGLPAGIDPSVVACRRHRRTMRSEAKRGRFWKYHDWIYDKQSEINPDNYNAKLMEWAGPAAWMRCSSAAAWTARRPTRK